MWLICALGVGLARANIYFVVHVWIPLSASACVLVPNPLRVSRPPPPPRGSRAVSTASSSADELLRDTLVSTTILIVPHLSPSHKVAP